MTEQQQWLNDVEHLFMCFCVCLLVSRIFFLVKYLFMSFAYVPVGFFIISIELPDQA